MKNLSFPHWYHVLLKDDRLASKSFEIFTQAEIQKKLEVPSAQPEDKIQVGESEQFSNYNYFKLLFDPAHPDQLVISFNDGSHNMFFSIEPTYEALAELSDDYISKARKIPPAGDIVTNVSRIVKGVWIHLSDPNKKTVTYLLGQGEWDDMVVLENILAFNRFLSKYCICQATSIGQEDNYTQYYTAFSASLFSLVRMELFGTTLFYISYEYIPVSNIDFVKQLKSRNTDDENTRNFPQDAPIDVIGSVLDLDVDEGTIIDLYALLDAVSKNDYNSLLYLSGMTYLDDNFEEIFFPLAAHPLEKFRDLVASEADHRESEKVLEEAIRNGISDEMLEELGR
jgi:hypothetical protein